MLSDRKDTEFLEGTTKKKELIIVFSAFQSSTTVKFSFNNYMRKKHKEGYSVLFIADTRNLWYLNGALSLGGSLAKTLTSIQALINKHEIETIFTVGGSMGGFGALLYAVLLDADYAFATGADSKIHAPGSNSKKMQTSGLIESLTDSSYWDLTSLLQNNTKTKYKIIVGSLSAIDSYFANQILNANHHVSVYTLPGCAHRVPVGFVNAKCVETVLDAFLSQEELASKCGLIPGIVHPVEVLDIWYNHFFLKEKSSVNVFLHLSEKYSNSGFVNYVLSQLFQVQGDDIKSEYYLKKAQTCTPPYGVDPGNTA